MAKILVVGSVNIDRVWHLDRPLRPGGRSSFTHAELRHGGGAFNTGRVLRECGHEVIVVSRVASDKLGDASIAALAALGIDTRFVARVPGETTAGEILLDPAGERTILSFAGRTRTIPDVPEITVDLVYLNVKSLSEASMAILARMPKVVTQLPLQPGAQYLADTLIASRSDIGERTERALWDETSQAAGSRLRHIVLTNGADAVSVIDKDAVNHVALREARPVRDTIGAGDYFAGGYIDGVLRRLAPVEAVTHANAVALHWLESGSPVPVDQRS